MNNHSNILTDVLRFLFVGLLFVICFFILTLLISSVNATSVQAQGTNFASSSLFIEMSESPNLITSSLVAAADGVSVGVTSVTTTSTAIVNTASSASIQAGTQIVRTTKNGALALANGLGAGLSFLSRVTANSIAFAFSIPGAIVRTISNTAFVNAIIRPSDHAQVPLIDPNSPELLAALNALPPTENSTRPLLQDTSGPIWPMHGKVTAKFGVAHWPYQPTHTGIDISDGRASGVTPIKPFRPGRVIEVVTSRKGLGNHVIVDHGNGVSSVYAHLASISARVDQEVTTTTILGTQGTTGLSTGTHLHFEIRVNGRAADPHKFISGQP